MGETEAEWRETMSIDWDRKQASWVVTPGAEPPEDWLAAVVRKALRSLVGDAEPSPAVWERILQSIANGGNVYEWEGVS